MCVHPDIIHSSLRSTAYSFTWYIWAWMLPLGACIPGEFCPWLGRIRRTFRFLVLSFFFMEVFPFWPFCYLVSFSGFISRHQHVFVTKEYPWHSGNQHMGQFSTAASSSTGRGLWRSMMKSIISRSDVGRRYGLLITTSRHLPAICILEKLEQNQGYLHNNILTFSRIL